MNGGTPPDPGSQSRKPRYNNERTARERSPWQSRRVHEFPPISRSRWSKGNKHSTNSFLYWVGVLCGSISLFNLLQKLIGFGFAEIVGDLIKYYRDIMHPLANIIVSPIVLSFKLLGLDPPYISPDIIIIYILLGGSLARSYMTIVMHPLLKHRWPFNMDKINVAKITLSFRRYETLTKIFIILGWPLAVVGIRDTSYAVAMLAHILFGLIQILLGFLILFTTNYYLT